MTIGAVALWAVLAVLFLVIELVTIGMVSLWFMIGAIAALIAAALGAAMWLQIAVFLIVSGACFGLLYPRLRHLIGRRRQPTNADMVLGQTCVVTQRIDNIAGTGAVKVAGKVWTARTEDDAVLPAGTKAEALRIEGVKLIVKPVSAPAEGEE